MRAGRLRDLITIQKYKAWQDNIGQTFYDWSDIAKVYAEIKSISGKELILSSVEMSLTTMKVNIRYRSDIDTSCRIKYSPAKEVIQYLNIKSVLPDSKRTYLELLCEVGLNDR